MTEITAENINTLITDDVKQFMKEVKVKKERSERQKENDAKLKDRLKIYHQQKKEAKLKEALEQETRFKHIQDTLEEVQITKLSLIDKEDDEIMKNVEAVEYVDIEDENTKALNDVKTMIKSKRGRPKKHQHPGPSEIIAASV